MQFTNRSGLPIIRPMQTQELPCVLMRAGTSRGPFFLREWLPEDEEERDKVLVGAIGASDLLALDGIGGSSNYSFKGSPNRDSDIYGNLISNCWDDAIESEGANMNVRIWRPC